MTLEQVSRVFSWTKRVNPGDHLEISVVRVGVRVVRKIFHYEARPIANVDIILISS